MNDADISELLGRLRIERELRKSPAEKAKRQAESAQLAYAREQRERACDTELFKAISQTEREIQKMRTDLKNLEERKDQLLVERAKCLERLQRLSRKSSRRYDESVSVVNDEYDDDDDDEYDEGVRRTVRPRFF